MSVKGPTSKTDVLSDYDAHMTRGTSFLLASFFLIVFFVVVAVGLGASRMPFASVARALFERSGDTASRIVWNIRLPRALGAVLAGAAISVAGVSMQSILKNPLASPYTLGTSHAAAFGAAFAIIFLHVGSMQSTSSDAVIINNPYAVTLLSFLFCNLATAVIVLLSRLRAATPETLVLAGVAMGSLFSAASSGLQYFADDVELSAVVFWTFGDLGRISWERLAIISVVVVLSCVYFMRNSWNYQIMDAGDETAKSLGINVERKRIEGMVVASLVTSVVVSFVGIIGFIGLVVPHIVRRIIGGYEPHLIAGSVLFGGLFLLMSDIVARTIISPTVLPVGVLTSFLGAPLFIYLLVKGRQYW